MKLTAKSKAINYHYSVDPNNPWMFGINAKSVDLNGDGVDEVIFAGTRHFQTSTDITASKAHIFGWKNGVFTDLTSQWLPYNVVDGVGDITVGDFNKDGKVDVYFSASADNANRLNAYQLINTGNTFKVTAIANGSNEHGTTTADINNDGYMDVVTFGYEFPEPILWGSATGLIKDTGTAVGSKWNPYVNLASGGVVADFLGNGTKTMVVVDSNGYDDTCFAVPEYVNGVLKGYAITGKLPVPIFDKNTKPGGTEMSHDVTAEAFDFSGDGLQDVLVFSTITGDFEGSAEQSNIQFLENKGNGKFVDVTDQRLIGYHHDTTVCYNPVFDDFNKDGLTDIFISSGQMELSNHSTAILIQQQNGTFVDSYRSEFAAILNQNGGFGTISKGADGNWHFINQTQIGGGTANVVDYVLTFDERNANESLHGTKNNDTIWGMGGNDTITGLDGNDLIIGGLGKDIMTGGAGKDVFDFNSVTESSANANRDVITDFKTYTDQINLADIDANIRLAGDQAFKFATKASPNAVWFSNGMVCGDINGNTIADFQIGLTGVSKVGAWDFIL